MKYEVIDTPITPTIAWEAGHDLALNQCNYCKHNKYNSIRSDSETLSILKNPFKSHGCQALDKLHESIQYGTNPNTSLEGEKIPTLVVLAERKLCVFGKPTSSIENEVMKCTKYELDIKFAEKKPSFSEEQLPLF